MKKTNVLLWVIQALLMLLFLFAGVTKFVLPAELLTQGGMSLGFVRFIGVCEILGAIGLIVPSVTRIRPGLTPLAAAGLVIIMIGATVVTLRMPQPAGAVVPAFVGLLAAFVAYGRWRLVPLRGRAPAEPTFS
jgi:uncharacterized membrane protein